MNDINNIFGKILYEFPLEQINICFPKWVESLDSSHWLKADLLEAIKNSFKETTQLKSIHSSIDSLQENDKIKKAIIDIIILSN
jgi:stage IV sporulation protein A